MYFEGQMSGDPPKSGRLTSMLKLFTVKPDFTDTLVDHVIEITLSDHLLIFYYTNK